MVQSSHKGSSYERDICKRLSLWLTNNEFDDTLWRTHGSGSRHTNRIKKGKDTYDQDGDIQAIHTDIAKRFTSIFSIECKHYKDLNLWSLFQYQKRSLVSFWEETHVQASRVYKIPVLIARQNNRPDLFASIDIMEQIFSSLGLKYKVSFTFQDSYCVYIYKLSDILTINIDTLESYFNSLELLIRHWRKNASCRFCTS